MACPSPIVRGAAVLVVLLHGGPALQAQTQVPAASSGCTESVHSQFDFWLGEWAVEYAPTPGSRVGSSVVTKIHLGCVVLETWSARGWTGQSFNIYDRSRHQWRRTWVDSTGELHEYWGAIRHGYIGTMVFEGDVPSPFGRTERRRARLTFFDLVADRVRLLSERLNVDGTVAEVVFDVIYSRKR